jgi:archaellum component FlaC
MSQNDDKLNEMIKRFSTLRNEFGNLSEQQHQINKRLNEIETEMSEIRNYLYRDRSRDFIQDVSVELDKMIKEDVTGEYRDAINELKEIIELWLKDYAHYTRYGTNHLTPHQRKKPSDKIDS